MSFGSFVTALSGLKAAGTAIDVIGNDLANLNTTGFKGSTLSFQDVVADVNGAANRQVGSGVAAPLIFKSFNQGSIQTTGGVYNAAIQGSGFFIVRKAEAGSPLVASPDISSDLFTRAGNFQIDKSGILVSATGERVQGWTLNTLTGAVSTSDPIGDIIVPLGANRPAKATTTFNAELNLDASAAAGAPFSFPVNVYDSLGNSHVLSANFTKDVAANSWDATVTTADPAVTLTGNGPFTFAFNTDGSLQTVTPSDPVTGNITGIQLALTNGAQSPQTLNWSPWQTPPVGTTPGVGRMTQFAEASAASAISQDGLAAAQLTSVSITDGGSVLAQYSNGSQRQVAQLALAAVRNPTSLISTGNNNFAAGEQTATPVIGQAGTGGRGTIVGGSLESSNVDIATEFTQLIIFQRTYSANARVITTTDQISQETINLIHA
jgi:flagellar hook protein FlgE